MRKVIPLLLVIVFVYASLSGSAAVLVDDATGVCKEGDQAACQHVIIPSSSVNCSVCDSNSTDRACFLIYVVGSCAVMEFWAGLNLESKINNKEERQRQYGYLEILVVFLEFVNMFGAGYLVYYEVELSMWVCWMYFALFLAHGFIILNAGFWVLNFKTRATWSDYQTFHNVIVLYALAITARSACYSHVSTLDFFCKTIGVVSCNLYRLHRAGRFVCNFDVVPRISIHYLVILFFAAVFFIVPGIVLAFK